MMDKKFRTSHRLKLKQEFWPAVDSGIKNFEIRKNDRGFQKGDVVTFTQPDCPRGTGWAGKSFVITYVLTGWGLKEDYCVFGTRPFIVGEDDK